MKILACIVFVFCVNSLFGSTFEEMGSGGVITGKVYTVDNKPAEAVTVQLITLIGKKSAVTNENGYFEFTNVPVGKNILNISFESNKPIVKEVLIEKGSKLHLQFQLEIQEKELQEVVVATKQKHLGIGKLSIADKDVPLSTGIIPNKIIQDQQVIRLGDVVKNVAGVSMVQTRFGVNESYSARGYTIGMTGGAGGGSIFKNGLPYNIAGIPEAATLESVEIIKGSSAFLYGSSSGGLIINMVNKKPQFEIGGNVSLLMGSYQQYKPIVDFYGPLSKKIAYRIVGTYENANSYRDNIKTIRKYINPSLLYKLSDKTSILFQQELLAASMTPDMGIGALDSGRILNTSIPRSRNQNVSWAFNNVQHNSSFISVKHLLNGNSTFHFSAMYQNAEVDSYGVGNLNTASKSGVIARPLAKAHSLENVFSSEAHVETKWSIRNIDNHAIFGLDYFSISTLSDVYNILNQNGSILKVYDTINLLNPSQYNQKTYTPSTFKTATTIAPSIRYGAYFQDLISLHKNFKVFLGGRYSYQANIQSRIDSTANFTRPSLTIRGSAPTAEYLVFSPKAGFIYQPNSEQSFYISYANNFTANTGTDVYGNILPASIMDQYELGTKQTFLEGRISLNTSVYKIVNSHLAQQAPFKADGITPNTDATIKTLSGETTSDGFEIGMNANISKGFYIISGYGYNFIRFTHSAGNKGSNIEGEPLVNAPQNTANFSMFYTFMNNRLNGLKIGLSGFYTGKRWGGYNNLIGQSILGSRLLPLSDFTTVDISLGYTKNRISIQTKLSNVFNTMNYLVHDNYSINPIAPRQCYLTLQYKF